MLEILFAIYYVIIIGFSIYCTIHKEVPFKVWFWLQEQEELFEKEKLAWQNEQKSS